MVSSQNRVCSQRKTGLAIDRGTSVQAYSVVGRSRNKNKDGYEPLKDEKHFLYREYLRIIANFWPAVFVMENVKGFLSSKPDPKDDPIFSHVLADLSAPSALQSSSQGPKGRKHRYKLFSLSPRRHPMHLPVAISYSEPKNMGSLKLVIG